MAATPPPPGRVHTPPAPYHGARHDNFEPYSPRRSSRVASQRKSYGDAQRLSASPTTKRRSARATTPTRPASSQTFSPPSSPNSPAPQLLSAKKRISVNSHRGTMLAQADAEPSGSAPVPREDPNGRSLLALGMLPTPAKTPRKRPMPTQAALSGTARILFSDRPATVEDAMPEPRKSRKGKKNAFSLASFEEIGPDDESSKIEIYTDSKERLPEVDETEENPFHTRRGANGTSKAKTDTTRRRKAKDQKALEMEKAVQNDEGLIFTFRGKKVLRKFKSSVDEDETPGLDEIDARHRTGVPQRMTRSSIKPRLLFPNEEQRRAREAAANAADEEAVTDIEPQGPEIDVMEVEEQHTIVTPVKQQFQASLSPTSSHPTNNKHPNNNDELLLPASAAQFDEDEEVAPIRPKKAGSFDGWRRTKSSSMASKGIKRGGDPMNGEAAKRTRSGAASSQ